MHVVVFRTGHLGDTVCAVPAFRRIREYFHNASLTLLCDTPVDDKVASFAVAKRLNIFNEIVTYQSGRGWRTPRDLFKCVRQLKPDVLILLSQIHKSQKEVEWQRRFFRLAGVKKLYGFKLPTHRGKWRPNVPARLLQVLDSEGINGVPSHYDIPVDESAVKSFKVKFQKVGLNPNVPYLIFCGGGKAVTQRWPMERYALVLESIYDTINVPILAIGSSKELDIYRELIQPSFRELHMLDSPLAIGELMEVTRGAIGYIGNDTGPMHLSAAMNTPVIAVISARNKPGQWDPDISQRLLFRHRVECEGCWVDECPFGHHECMMSIHTDEVISKSVKFLQEILQ